MKRLLMNITFVQGAHAVCGKTLESICESKREGDTFYSTLKLGHYILMGAEKLYGTKKPITNLMKHIGCGMSVIDVFELPTSLKYWTSGTWKTEFWAQNCAMASLTAATVGGFGLWLGEMGAIDLGNISASLGNIPVIGGAFSVVSLVSAVNGLAGVGYGFLAINAIRNIVTADNAEKRIKGLLELISYVAHVALFTTMFITGISLWTTVTLGVIAAGFGVLSPLYKHFNEKAFLPQNNP